MYEREEIKLRNAWKKLEESFDPVVGNPNAFVNEGGEGQQPQNSIWDEGMITKAAQLEELIVVRLGGKYKVITVYPKEFSSEEEAKEYFMDTYTADLDQDYYKHQ